ncbi:CpaF family protein [Desulfosporosinus sp. BICA1-9]|uniref:CpaF family protein n=1 Tax=Desulfosporosinus sp. BICA1-9 TaxID=1531958 RepID=UPI00054B1E34|nr:CpaF family protein [Desulfosporosinus sp. BICA1-9]KJS48123.1 MAG: type II secretion system protein E [Peptococcaceae bacterium BRH_c23]KJS78411.1 MAG: type II secretion system protein E [Desulfosporosinus sp. BICA1-9]HBW36577.1 CpaF family protein [Desulfosporosinus sp.]
MSLLKRLEKEKIQPHEESRNELRTVRPTSTNDPWREFKSTVHHEVIQALDKINTQDLNAETLHPIIERTLDARADVLGLTPPRMERQRLVQEVMDEILGFGPIEPLLQDPNVNEIMVNGPHQVYVERKGKLELAGVTFYDDAHVLHIIEKIVAPLGRRIDESQPMVDARLPDGSRVNAIIPPLSLNGPILTIRKFSKVPFGMEDLVGFGTLTTEMAEFIDACVKARLNVIVSGGTGSGKTTTLGVISAFIPEDERIITIEDAAELQLRQTHVVTLETRPANMEGKGAIMIRDLVRNALRMRPERIIVGEVRSGEALDMLQAMNTGHDGSLTTGHANTPRDMLSRLETMVLMAGMDLPVRAIREQISSALDVIVQQSRLRDGSRKLTHITEVLGMEGDVIVLQDIYRFEQTGIDKHGKVQGHFRATGIRPHFVDKLIAAGQILPDTIFSN